MSREMLALVGGGSIIGALAFLYLGVSAMRRRSRAKPPRETETGDELADGDIEDEEKASAFGKIGSVLRPSSEQAMGKLRNRLVQAGLYGRDSVDLYLSVRLTVIIGGLLVFVVWSQTVESLPGVVVLLMAVASVSILAPSIWLDMRTTKRKVEISRTLPGTLDLLVTCLDAGLNLEQALTRVASETRFGDDLLSQELRITLEEIRAGLSTAVAFQRLAARLGHDEVKNLSALVAQASNLGANLGDTLRSHSQTMRKHRIVFLEEQAGKANAKLTLPLTMCLLPSVMILLLGPAVLMIMQSY